MRSISPVSGFASGNLIALISSLLLSTPLPVLAAEPAVSEQPEALPKIFGLGWLDQTQSMASSSANGLAMRMDRFFGVQRSDVEAAYSSLRLTSIHYWEDVDEYKSGMRLRGRLYLPRISEKVSLIFSDENGEDNEYTQAEASISGDEKTRVNLEMNMLEKDAHRFFFRLSGRSGFNLRPSLRYRYEPVKESRTINRFTQDFHYETSEGFGSFSRYQLDHVINPESLVRWTNDLHLEESLTGAEYTTAFEYLTLRSNKTAISWYTRINGQTSPGFIVSYDVGVRYRKNIYRKWLYMEIEPGFTWRKEGYYLSRETVPYIFLRLEMAIGSFN